MAAISMHTSHGTWPWAIRSHRATRDSSRPQGPEVELRHPTTSSTASRRGTLTCSRRTTPTSRPTARSAGSCTSSCSTSSDSAGKRTLPGSFEREAASKGRLFFLGLSELNGDLAGVPLPVDLGEAPAGGPLADDPAAGARRPAPGFEDRDTVRELDGCDGHLAQSADSNPKQVARARHRDAEFPAAAWSAARAANERNSIMNRPCRSSQDPSPRRRPPRPFGGRVRIGVRETKRQAPHTGSASRNSWGCAAAARRKRRKAFSRAESARIIASFGPGHASIPREAPEGLGGLSALDQGGCEALGSRPRGRRCRERRPDRPSPAVEIRRRKARMPAALRRTKTSRSARYLRSRRLAEKGAGQRAAGRRLRLKKSSSASNRAVPSREAGGVPPIVGSPIGA